jgi:hypothetical protein
MTFNQGGHLEYNPYASQLAELEKMVSLTEGKRDDCLHQLDWYDHFDGGKASSLLYEYKREIVTLDKALQCNIEELNNLATRLASLKKELEVNFNIFYLFSSERKAKKIALELAENKFAQLQRKRNDLHQTTKEKKCILDALQVDFDRHNSFDPREAKATIKALTFQIEKFNSQIQEVQRLKDRVDKKLVKLLAELNVLTQRKSETEADVAVAENLNVQLSRAPNSYERKMIHENCDATFGESKPAKVISEKRAVLESVKRNIQKLHGRIIVEANRAARTIKKLVIDGNNLCYQQQRFIGLAALLVVAKRLEDEFLVEIIFDASIRALLKMPDRDIAARFGDRVKVHVVSSQSKADETVLNIAADKSDYVISNDRFSDYPEKAAVLGNRIVRHEILSGQVFIYDLDVAERFETVA